MLKRNRKGYTAARIQARFLAALVKSYLTCPFGSPAALAIDRTIRRLLKPGYYEHFKSSPKNRKYYRVLGIEQTVTSKNWRTAYHVRYQSLYGPMRGRKGTRELLGKDGFFTPISRKVYTGPRFILVSVSKPKDSIAKPRR